MTRTFAALALSVAAAVALQEGTQTAAPQTAAPQPAPQPAEASPCQGIAAQPGQLGGVLKGVDRYGSTYVLVVPQRLAESVPDVKAAAAKGLHVAVEGGSAAAEAARAAGLTNLAGVGDDSAAPFQALQDVTAGKTDAAVMWAPLAGLAILELGLDGAVTVYAIDRPHGPPAAYGAAAAAAGPCSAAIREELDVSGVLPAELLVPVEIRTLLDRRPPPFDLDQARQGGVAFNELCARCHGPDAVADPHGLAPVDLRISIRRFSYPGFDYIVLNGRPEKSMPPLRGTVSEEQIRLIYQYLQGRSNGVLTSDKKGSN